jgi:hypothetical protein
MGERKGIEQFMFERLTERNGFLSVDVLDIVFHVANLCWFNGNILNIRQVNIPHSKFNVVYNCCEASCVENVRLGGGLTEDD